MTANKSKSYLGHYPGPDSHNKDKAQVVLDLPNYTTNK